MNNQSTTKIPHLFISGRKLVLAHECAMMKTSKYFCSAREEVARARKIVNRTALGEEYRRNIDWMRRRRTQTWATNQSKPCSAYSLLPATLSVASSRADLSMAREFHDLTPPPPPFILVMDTSLSRYPSLVPQITGYITLQRPPCLNAVTVPRASIFAQKADEPERYYNKKLH